MAGRIRSVKPEWLDDEKLSHASLAARVLSIGLILIADDHGRGRGHPIDIGAAVFKAEPNPREVAAAALKELVEIEYIVTYTVRGQSYFAIRTWARHQRVDKPGPPRVPKPEEADGSPSSGDATTKTSTEDKIRERVANPPERLATDLDLRSGSGSPTTTSPGREEVAPAAGETKKRSPLAGRPELVEVLGRCRKLAGFDLDDIANGLDTIAMNVGANDERVVAVAAHVNAMLLTEPVDGQRVVGWYRKTATRLMRRGELEKELNGGDGRASEPAEVDSRDAAGVFDRAKSKGVLVL